MGDWKPVDLGDPVLNREVNLLTAAADRSPARWWWLSFADPHLPAGTQFLGVAIVSAQNVPMASIAAHRLGCNPGGEIRVGLIPEDRVPEPEWRERLLTRSEAEALL